MHWDIHDCSSVEVEEMLPPNEPVEDPRHFYASDSPVCKDFNSDSEVYKSAKDLSEAIEPEGEVENVTSNTQTNVRLFCWTFLPLTRLFRSPLHFPHSLFFHHPNRLNLHYNGFHTHSCGLPHHHPEM